MVSKIKENCWFRRDEILTVVRLRILTGLIIFAKKYGRSKSIMLLGQKLVSAGICHLHFLKLKFVSKEITAHGKLYSKFLIFISSQIFTYKNFLLKYLQNFIVT